MTASEQEHKNLPVAVRRPASLPAPSERRRIRRRAGVSGVDLAAAIGVAPGSVYAWETSTRDPKGLQRDAYARVLQELVEALEVEAGEPWPSR